MVVCVSSGVEGGGIVNVCGYALGRCIEWGWEVQGGTAHRDKQKKRDGEGIETHEMKGD